MVDLNDSIEHDLLFSESSAEEDDEPVQKKKKSEDLIFEGSVITAVQAAFLIFQFCLRHHLTTKAISELLLLISVLLPLGNRLSKSVYKLKRLIVEEIPDICVFNHYYCSDCLAPLTSKTSKCPNTCCTSDQFDHFITAPLGPQLKHMMEGSVCVCVCVCLCLCV